MTTRIAMWSGPRNISTAMMRAFENRPDTAVVDEPFYAHYLATTGKAHPAADAVMRAQSTDWTRVADDLCHGAPADVFYQKHMAHHICGDMTLEWTEHLEHGFLLREPAAMLTSLSRVLDEVQLQDTGLEQQVRLYRHLRSLGRTPPVIDSRDVLEDPENAMRTLCDAFAIPFSAAMLAWPAGPRASDGVWAPHWYAAVEASTGFGPYVPFNGEVPLAVQPLLAPASALYDELSVYRITL